MRKETIVSASFLLPLFCLSALSLFLPQKHFSEMENRYLAGKPEFTWEKFADGTYGKACETWISDQFPFRKTFVAARTNAERLMLKEDVNGIYFGEEHYYMEKYDSEDLMTEQMEKNTSLLAQAAGHFAAQLGSGHVKIMLVPSASQVLTENLPPFAAPADQSAVTDTLKKKLAQVPGAKADMVLPIEQEFKKNSMEPLYYRTDHHWTTLGAYYAYQLYGRYAGFQPRSWDQFIERTVSETFQGTIQSRLGIALKPDEIKLFLPKEKESVQIYYDGRPEPSERFYDESALKKKDQYAVFLGGNHGWTEIVNRNVKKGSVEDGKKLLIINDSFANSFVPFLTPHFEEVHMVDLRYFNKKLSEFVKEQEITDILVLYQVPGFAKDGNLFKIVR